jgi:hypothetical protein
MKKIFYLTLPLTAGFLFLGGCQKTVFGVNEAVWEHLNETEREKVIEGYNKRQELELANLQKQKEKELENERHRQEVAEKTAPFYAAVNVVSALSKGSKKNSSYRTPLYIQAISHEIGSHTVTIGDELFEVSVFSKISDAWVKGQEVVLTSSDKKGLYPVKIKNLDNGETLDARKVKKWS